MGFLTIAGFGAVSIWALIALFRGSVFLSTALFLVSTACLPAEFLSVDAAGLTWTLDRIWFLVLIAQTGIRWHRGQLQFSRLEYCDAAVGLFFMWLVARTITQPWGSVLPEQPPTLMHLVNGYFIPFVIYAVLRTLKVDQAQLRSGAFVLLGMGIYLSVTAFFEVGHIWSLVFPRYISDPDLSIHFGRARGPMLQSVRLGVCLVASWVAIAVYTVWVKPDCRIRWFVFAGSTFLFGGAIFFTYTRSIWMGFAFCVCVLVGLGLQGLPRRFAILGIMTGCMLIGVLKGPELIAFKREYSAAETRESTYMRAAFAYVSIEMFKDKPVAGFGFNQFQVHNGPYLSDRSTNIRLSSIRGYVHHNSFLSLLVDLGIVGFSLYVFLMLTMFAQARALWIAESIPREVRGLALIAFALGGTHFMQMAFHEVSFSSIENGILFTVLGLVVAANQQYRIRPSKSALVKKNER